MYNDKDYPPRPPAPNSHPSTFNPPYGAPRASRPTSLPASQLSTLNSQLSTFYAPPPPQQKRQMHVGIKALLMVFGLIVAIMAGFVGGYIANVRRPIPIADEAMPSISQIAPSLPWETAAQPFENAAPDSEMVNSATLISNPAAQTMTTPEVAAAVRQSVVEIKTETVRSGGWTGTYVSEGAGSGVIISEDGYIITNNHVITGASNIYVSLVDGREFPATLIATDQRTDIAVIKISGTGLQPASFGDSSTLVVGESAIAVGNPLGELGGTVTGVIISALDREMIVEGEAMTLLQTDAAVNPGNSGGGLFNMRAELIGVVNAKSGGLNIEGLGFAIPSNVAKKVAGDLIMHGFVRGRTDTGLELIDIQSTQTARWYRVNQLGLYIVNSDNERFRNGDMITAVDGFPIADLYDYTEALKNRSVGDTVTITVSRGDESISGDITLIEWSP